MQVFHRPDLMIELLLLYLNRDIAKCHEGFKGNITTASLTRHSVCEVTRSALGVVSEFHSEYIKCKTEMYIMSISSLKGWEVCLGIQSILKFQISIVSVVSNWLCIEHFTKWVLLLWLSLHVIHLFQKSFLC